MKILLPILVLLAGAPVLAVPLTVSVVDEKNAPVAGADVQLQSYAKAPKGTLIVQSDANGKATFEVEPSPQYPDFIGRIVVWKPTFALGGGNLNLKTPLQIVLKAPQSVEGVVSDENGKPVAGATVRLSWTQPKGDGGRNYSASLFLAEGALSDKIQTVSDANGSWKIEQIPPDSTANLIIHAANFANATAQVESGQAAKTTLVPGAQISGRLLGLDGQGLADTRVFATDQSDDYENRGSGESKTGADGTFTIDGLKRGVYSVGFSLKDENSLVARVRNITADPQKPAQLPDARAESGIVLTGKVVEKATGKPLEGVTVALQSDDGFRQYDVGQSDKNGAWTIRTLQKSGKLYLQSAPLGFIRDSEQRPLEVAQPDAAKLDFKLERAPKITGRLVDENGRGIKTTTLAFKQRYEEYQIVSDENGDFETYGPKDGEVEVSLLRYGSDVLGANTWDVVGQTKFSLPAPAPLQIKLKKAELSNLEIGVFDQNDAALEGAKVSLSLSTWDGDSGTSRPFDLTSDKAGRVHLEGIRKDEKVELKSASKAGFDAAKLPEIQKVGALYRADITLKARGGAAKGQIFDAAGKSAAKTQVFGSGIETISDENGNFSLGPLPNGKSEILAWKNDGFALGWSDQTRFDLQTPTLQATDKARAAQILADLIEETKNTKYWRKDSLKTSEISDDFEVASAANLTGGAGVYSLIQRFGADANIAVDKWIALLNAPPQPTDRLYSAGFWNSRAPIVPDDDATRAWLDGLEKDVASVENGANAGDKWQNAIGIFGAAALAERLGETARADALFLRAQAFVIKNFPVTGGINGNNPSQDDTFAVMSELIAVTPRLMEKLAGLVDNDTAAYGRILGEGAPTLARLQGLKAALPFLERLKNAPAPKPDANGATTSTRWNYFQSAIKAVIVGAKSDPQSALELAQSLPANNDDFGVENYGARIISEVAFFQPPAAAAALWRKWLPQVEADVAMQFAARIQIQNPELARELYEQIREKFEAQATSSRFRYGNSPLAGFAFFEAQFDAARARFRLEKGFQKALQDPESRYGLGQYARAMARFDVDRALGFADQIGNEENSGFDGFEAKRQIARYMAQSESARQKIKFSDRYGSEGDDF